MVDETSKNRRSETLRNQEKLNAERLFGLIDDMIVLLGLPALYEYIFVAVILVVAGLQARGKGFVK